MLDLTALFLASLVIPFLGTSLSFFRIFKRLKLHLVISFALGFLFFILFFEFLKEVYGKGEKLSYSFIFLGIISIFLCEKYLNRYLSHLKLFMIPETKEHKHHQIIHEKASCSSMTCFLICGFFDGLEIMSFFQFGLKTGFFSFLALSIHVLSDSFILSSISLESSSQKKQVWRTAFLMSLFIFSGGFFAFLMKNLFDFELFLLPFASGVLIYICFFHLLPVVLKSSRGFLAMLFGFLCAGLMH